jgi:hypothetical protein
MLLPDALLVKILWIATGPDERRRLALIMGTRPRLRQHGGLAPATTETVAERIRRLHRLTDTRRVCRERPPCCNSPTSTWQGTTSFAKVLQLREADYRVFAALSQDDYRRKPTGPAPLLASGTRAAASLRCRWATRA